MVLELKVFTTQQNFRLVLNESFLLFTTQSQLSMTLLENPLKNFVENVDNPSKNKSQIFSHIYFVNSYCFELGPV